MKRSLFFLLAVIFAGVSFGLTGGNDLKVIIEEADIYAEPDSDSYLIETVERGTSLNLFQKGKIRKEWYYIVFFSEKRKGRVSGFIQESMVVAASDFKDIVKTTPIPPFKTVSEPEPTGKIPGFRRDEELSTTPLGRIGVIPLRDVASQNKSTVSPSVTLDTLAFREISEIPVAVEKSRSFTDMSIPEIEGTVFLKIYEPPVEIQTRNVSAINPAPTQEGWVFEIIEVRPEDSEELSVTPLFSRSDGEFRASRNGKKDEDRDEVRSRVSSVMEEVAFREVMEPPVELTVKPIMAMTDFPQKEAVTFQKNREILDERQWETELSPTPLLARDNLPWVTQKLGKEARAHQVWMMTGLPDLEVAAFQRTFEPPVELNTSSMPDLTAFPPQEVREFQAFEEISSEELSMTPILENNHTRFLGNNGDERDGNNGNGLPLVIYSTKETAAFRSITEPPVEITSKAIPPVNPLSELEGLAFKRPRKAAPKKVKESVPDIEHTKTRKAEVTSTTVNSKPKIEKPQEKIEPKPFPVQPRKEKKFKWFTLGLGYGQSLGGVGGFLQFNTKAGISFHGGVGYYPSAYIYAPHDWVKNVILFNGGIKYYLPLQADPIHVYLDLQYGGIGVEAAQIITGIWRNNFFFDYKQKTLWGPSLLTGVEFRVGHIGLNGALGLSYNLTKLDWSIQNYFFTFDIGLLLLF